MDRIGGWVGNRSGAGTAVLRKLKELHITAHIVHSASSSAGVVSVSQSVCAVHSGRHPPFRGGVGNGHRTDLPGDRGSWRVLSQRESGKAEGWGVGGGRTKSGRMQLSLH